MSVDLVRLTSAHMLFPRSSSTLLMSFVFRRLNFMRFWLPRLLHSYHPSCQFLFCPATSASRGILTASDTNWFSLTSHFLPWNFVSSSFFARTNDLMFFIVNIYGPCVHAKKAPFLASLANFISLLSTPVCIMWDFNLLRHSFDRSNNIFNFPKASLFNNFIHSSDLQEIPLLDREFNWYNF